MPRGRGLAVAFQRSAVMSTHSSAWIYVMPPQREQSNRTSNTLCDQQSSCTHKFRWKQLSAEHHSGPFWTVSTVCQDDPQRCEDFTLSLAQPAKSSVWTKFLFLLGNLNQTNSGGDGTDLPAPYSDWNSSIQSPLPLLKTRPPSSPKRCFPSVSHQRPASFKGAGSNSTKLYWMLHRRKRR